MPRSARRGSPSAAAAVYIAAAGHAVLVADGVDVDVRAGEMYLVPAGVEHAVRPGSRGTLVIVEQV
ncbi:cupin domain-containing protein [Streptomyces musisoli]|uniref:cupin domain-containing protein n=1 Tax=Streptomyces musisoli TaxID=2802280 RepID=UPI0035583A3D